MATTQDFIDSAADGFVAVAQRRNIDVAALNGSINGRLNTSGSNAAPGLLANIGAAPRVAEESEPVSEGTQEYTSRYNDTVNVPQAIKFAETRNILEWIDPAKYEDIENGTLSGNLNAEIQAAVNSGAINIFVPPGDYPINTVGFSIQMETPGVIFRGAGPTSRFIDVAPDGSEARSVFLTMADDITLQDFYVDSNGSTKVNPTWVPPGTSGAIALGGAINLMGNRNRAIGLTVVNGWDNCIGVGKFNVTTGAQTDSAPFGCFVSGCYTRNAGSGVQNQYGYLIQLGGGVNNLTAMATVVENCVDEYSKVGFINDFAGGARGSFNGCRAYSNTRALYPLDDDPGIPEGFTAEQLRTGGFGFYFAGNAQATNCDAYNSERHGYWFDGFSFSCLGKNLSAKGCKQSGAWIQGRDNVIDITADYCSYENPGQYPAVLVEGVAFLTISTFGPSTNQTVNVNAIGPYHSYAIEAKNSFGLEGQYSGGLLSGTDGEVLSNAGGFVAASTQYLGGLRGTGSRVFARTCGSALVNQFGDLAGNGNLWFESEENPTRRLAMGVDNARSVGVINAIEAGVGPLPLELNPNSGPTRVHSFSNDASPIGDTNNPAGLEAVAIQNRLKKVAVAYNGATDQGEIQAITEGVQLEKMAINPNGGGVYLGGGAWGSPLELRGDANVTAYLWVTDDERLWIKTGSPPSGPTDGTVVGSQTT